MCLLRYNDSIQISAARCEEYAEHLEGYREHLARVVGEGQWSAREASLLAPGDGVAAAATYEVADALRHDDLTHILVIGIGGSNLGAQAIWSALGGHYASVAAVRPQLVFLDTTDPGLLARVRTLIGALPSPESIAT
ncbi:hypothetical protein GVX82_00885, partial [Patescibacteria group bacterium]|nr:hypothetical protein [Patescibacteria group bacterium]